MADFTSVLGPDHYRRNRLVIAAVVAVTTVAVVLTIDAESAAVGRPSASRLVEGPIVAGPPSTTTPSTTAAPPSTTSAAPVATPAVAATIAVPEPRRATPVLVPDPRGGDLRFDQRADGLPADYVAPVAPTTVLDVAYGADPAQRLDLHLPTGSDAPLVVFLHSGGWVGGDKRNIPEVIRRFVDRGYAIASVNYRLAPAHPFPAPVDDIVLAIDWLRAYGERDGHVDGDRLVLAGVSAGGHLAAFAGATIDGAWVDAVVAIVAPTDLTTLHGHDHPWAAPLTEAFVGCSPCTDDELAEASPISHVHENLPPAYWAFGAQDVLVDIDEQGIALADAWAAAAGPEMSWLDVAERHGHNLEPTSVNQRFLEAFVDRAVDR